MEVVEVGGRVNKSSLVELGERDQNGNDWDLWLLLHPTFRDFDKGDALFSVLL
jgi:hypothetical protein